MVKTKIKWLNKCRYISEVIESTFPPNKKGDKMEVLIIGKEDNIFTLETQNEGLKIRFKVRKISK
jgi:hypothetical protein